MPDQFRPTADALADRGRALPPPDVRLLARFRRPPPGLRREQSASDRSTLARPPALLRVLPWRKRRRSWRQPPDRLDRLGRQTDRAVGRHPLGLPLHSMRFPDEYASPDRSIRARASFPLSECLRLRFESELLQRRLAIRAEHVGNERGGELGIAALDRGDRV